ncbi:hypothetical protein [Klebsiella phage vB_KpnS-VAC2]|uniref:Uncharacterized protein n=1 Tax=Klebsiella phage vB_KpnS-VAC2 TaxID=2864369 RepID=A0AAE7XIY2_9CAUD|nr:hypothetical protein [Klebsiella phage vB_KpnS-VAC2]
MRIVQSRKSSVNSRSKGYPLMNTIRLKCIAVAPFVHIACKPGDIITATRDSPFSDWCFDGYCMDKDLVIRGVNAEFATFKKFKPKTDRKLVARAMRIIARQYGWTDASVRRRGNYKTVKEWARDWADYYVDDNGELLHDITEYMEDCSRGDAIREFMEAEIDAL